MAAAESGRKIKKKTVILHKGRDGDEKTSIIIGGGGGGGGGLYPPRWQENTMSGDFSDLILQEPSKKRAETTQEEPIRPDLVHEIQQELGKFPNRRRLRAL